MLFYLIGVATLFTSSSSPHILSIPFVSNHFITFSLDTLYASIAPLHVAFPQSMSLNLDPYSLSNNNVSLYDWIITPILNI